MNFEKFTGHHDIGCCVILFSHSTANVILLISPFVARMGEHKMLTNR